MKKFLYDTTHVPIALGIMALTWLIGANVWAAAFAGISACVMREVTQAEYQWIESHGGLRAAMPGFEGLKFWRWNTHSKLETLYALVAAIVVAIMASII
jgi:hypothetical protein